MEYEDYLIREMNDGPVHWCSQCEKQYEDCICSDDSALGGHADSDGVSVPLSLSAPPPSENALTEFDRVALSGAEAKSKVSVHDGGCRTTPLEPSVVAAQTPVQILNQTFNSVMRHFKI